MLVLQNTNAWLKCWTVITIVSFYTVNYNDKNGVENIFTQQINFTNNYKETANK